MQLMSVKSNYNHDNSIVPVSLTYILCHYNAIAT